jgi:hypothetical protein
VPGVNPDKRKNPELSLSPAFPFIEIESWIDLFPDLTEILMPGNGRRVFLSVTVPERLPVPSCAIKEKVPDIKDKRNKILYNMAD